MPIFYFNVRGDGFEAPDLAGRECRDSGAARAEAERLAAELVESALVSGEMPPDAVVEVDDQNLRPLLTLPLTPGEPS